MTHISEIGENFLPAKMYVYIRHIICITILLCLLLNIPFVSTSIISGTVYIHVQVHVYVCEMPEMCIA